MNCQTARQSHRCDFALQTNASQIGSLQSDVRTFFRSYLRSFIKPEVLTEADDITEIEYRTNKVDSDERGIGTSTRFLLCGELEDDVVGTVTESRFFLCVRSFYETSVEKNLPFQDNTLKEIIF